MTDALDFIAHTIDRGGPESEDFRLLDDSFRVILKDVVAPRHKALLRSKVAHVMGDAYTCATVQGMVYQKPHGVAGDFEVIERTYGHYLARNERLRRWDCYWQQLSFAEATRFQKAYLKGWIRKKENEHPSASILDVGCGSSRGVYEYLLENPSESKFVGLDADQDAIDYSKLICRNFKHQVGLHCCNFMQYDTDSRYDLVWSAGVFERLNDAEFKRGLKKLVSMSKPGSTVVVSNVSTSNPSQSYLDLLGWTVVQRSQAHMRYLALACDIPVDSISVELDEWGVNLYLLITVPDVRNRHKSTAYIL
ncbi:MAG: methyltransferase domain-containing protein [Hahellaceae bacterium]|nr:methyltransferase domain-containing protein [Hahellaceae bacterium]